ncbi:MAG: COX15/CtaA family protein [Gammaproteobacteria bacterium]
MHAVALNGLSTDHSDALNRRQIAAWLLICCGLVLSMVVLGGVTRLTGSGLSMVEWEPIAGILPPRGEAGWEAEFARYRESPQYQQVNLGMTLAEFKVIFWFEYAHRLLGRALGLAFLVPFLYFWIRGKLPRSLVPSLIILFAMGGFQGLLGWYMVKSGLAGDPHVSQYRLAAHLVVAVGIYGYMLWLALGLLRPLPSVHLGTATVKRLALGVTALVVLTIVSGAFVAGLKAGFTFNTFPKMGDSWIPAGILSLDPLHRNFFENLAMVQFQHRVLAGVVLLSVFILWWVARRQTLTPGIHVGLYLLLVMALIQAGLGIGTLLLHVPTGLAAAHQASALLLFTLALITNHNLRTPNPS